MAVEKRSFGKDRDGQEITLYTISNSRGMKAQVTDYGAVLVSLWVPDAQGNCVDVVLGFDKAEDYFVNPSFFGATIGPNANRIADARVTIDGVTYLLDVNEGVNNLHSHKDKGYHKRLWQAVTSDNSVTFTLQDGDGSMGFPGNKTFQVTYTLEEENALTLRYHACSDKKTVINPTNHTYFNLNGQGNGRIEEHEMWINASYYTPVDSGSIPTGEIAAVAGTPMDFMQPQKVGAQIEADFEQLKLTQGYDHNWAIDGWNGELVHFATVKSSQSGIEMKAFTTLPGVQFYAGNCIVPQTGKEGSAYDKRSGLCLETQYYPNSANQPDFPSCIFGGDKDYDSVTVYQFASHK